MNSKLYIIMCVLAGLFCIAAGCVTSPSVNTTTNTPLVTDTQTSAPPQQGTDSGTLIRDMALLDQAYIPVLALTSQNNSAASRKAMDALLPEWNTFQAKYENYQPADPGWIPDLETVNTTIVTADNLISRGDLPGAHNALEQVRLTMLDLRTRNHIVYFIDNLTLFHEPMETIVLAAQDRPADEVDVATIARVLPDANARWNTVSSGNIDAELFNFNQSQVQQIHGLIDSESFALANLSEALKTGDKGAIGNASVAIKGPFSTLFAAYGKFPS